MAEKDENNQNDQENTSDKDTKAPSVDYEKIAAGISGKVMESVNPQIEKINQKVDSALARNNQDPDDDGGGNGENEDDDTLMTSGEVNKLVDEKVGKKVNSILNANAIKATNDNEALNVFPMMNSASPTFDQEFANAVRQEVEVRVGHGRDRDNDPTLLMDAASAVYAKNPKYQKRSLEYAKEQQRQMNNREGNFSVNGRGQKGADKPNANQIALAKKMNISPERFEKIWKEKKLGS